MPVRGIYSSVAYIFTKWKMKFSESELHNLLCNRMRYYSVNNIMYSWDSSYWWCIVYTPLIFIYIIHKRRCIWFLRDWTCLDNPTVSSPSPSPSVSPASNLLSTELLAVSVVVPLIVLVAVQCAWWSQLPCSWKRSLSFQSGDRQPEGHHTIFTTETSKVVDNMMILCL